MIRLAVRVRRADADAVLAELLALSPGGLEERDVDASTVEYVIYGAPGELPHVGEVRAAAGGALVEVATSELEDDWSERWREWHRPLDIGPLRVRPPWAPAREGALDVVIDPGQAFGTGAHPSTRLSLEVLAGLSGRGALADWGCGSGVLAVAAARLGFGPVFACDVEAESVAATLAAASANGFAGEEVGDISVASEFGAPHGGADSGRLSGRSSAADSSAPIGDRSSVATDSPAADRPRILVGRLDLRRSPGPWAPTVTANLVRPLLLEVATLMDRPPQRLIASGLEVGEVEEVAEAFARHGLALTARRDGDGWSAILLSR